MFYHVVNFMFIKTVIQYFLINNKFKVLFQMMILINSNDLMEAQQLERFSMDFIFI